MSAANSAAGQALVKLCGTVGDTSAPRGPTLRRAFPEQYRDEVKSRPEICQVSRGGFIKGCISGEGAEPTNPHLAGLFDSHSCDLQVPTRSEMIEERGRHGYGRRLVVASYSDIRISIGTSTNIVRRLVRVPVRSLCKWLCCLFHVLRTPEMYEVVTPKQQLPTSAEPDRPWLFVRGFVLSCECKARTNKPTGGRKLEDEPGTKYFVSVV